MGPPRGYALRHLDSGSRVFRLLSRLESDPAVVILVPKRELQAYGPDTAWSLTGCIAFVARTERELSESFTGDPHFEQTRFGHFRPTK